MSEDRFVFLAGRVSSRKPTGGGPHGLGSSYEILSAAGDVFQCGYTDVVTDGFRTLEQGESVRFAAEQNDRGEPTGRAVFVVRQVNHEGLFYQGCSTEGS